jgi:hypothetical protein
MILGILASSGPFTEGHLFSLLQTQTQLEPRTGLRFGFGNVLKEEGSAVALFLLTYG